MRDQPTGPPLAKTRALAFRAQQTSRGIKALPLNLSGTEGPDRRERTITVLDDPQLVGSERPTRPWTE
jgi:hypothetical protein